MATRFSARTMFYRLLSAAIDDFLEYGFDSQERLEAWLRELRIAARNALVPEYVLERELRASLTRAFKTATSPPVLIKRHKGVDRYTLERIKPALRGELDRRILASANLIKLNRDASIEKTLQRFSGWATSIPIGGTQAGNKAETAQNVRRGIAGLPFEERRVIVDQGAKLSAAVSDIVAQEGGAIIATWQHVHEAGYDARPEHEARDGEIFVIRDNWAMKDGLMKLARHKYTDQIEQPAELPFCRCKYVYGYTLRDLPKDMLTAKGKQALTTARAQIQRVTQQISIGA